jgi:hypothetical protein
MKKSDFEILLQIIGPRIQRKYKKYREAIRALIRLAEGEPDLPNSHFLWIFPDCSLDN